MKYFSMDEFGCFFRVNNIEFDSMWLSLALSFVWAGLMLFLIFCYKTFIFRWIWIILWSKQPKIYSLCIFGIEFLWAGYFYEIFFYG